MLTREEYINQWRKEFLKTYQLQVDMVDELEDHLRQELENLREINLSDDEIFTIELNETFAKVNSRSSDNYKNLPISAKWRFVCKCGVYSCSGFELPPYAISATIRRKINYLNSPDIPKRKVSFTSLQNIASATQQS